MDNEDEGSGFEEFSQKSLPKIDEIKSDLKKNELLNLTQQAHTNPNSGLPPSDDPRIKSQIDLRKDESQPIKIVQEMSRVTSNQVLPNKNSHNPSPQTTSPKPMQPVFKGMDVKSVLKLPDIPTSPQEVDNSKPGCFGGKNFRSPRSTLRKDSIFDSMKNKLEIMTGQQSLDQAVTNIHRSNLSQFNFISTEVPSHLTINPDQKKILNVRYKDGKPVKRSVLGDKDSFYAKQLQIETEKSLGTNLATLMIKQKLQLEEERQKGLKRKPKKPKPSLSTYKVNETAIKNIIQMPGLRSYTKLPISPQHRNVTLMDNSGSYEGEIQYVADDTRDVDLGYSQDEGFDLLALHPSAETVGNKFHFEELGPDGQRVKRAYIRHEKNIKQWERTIQIFQQLRYDKCLQDRVCGVKEKMQTAKLNNTHRSPSALRTLIEIQKYFEAPALNKEESFMVKAQQEHTMESYQQDLKNVQSIQQLPTLEGTTSNHPIMFQNMKDTSRNHFNITSQSALNVDVKTITLPEMSPYIHSGVNSPHITNMSRSQVAASTFHQSQSAIRLRNNKTQSPHAKRADQIENDHKFFRGLRQADCSHVPTTKKNSYQTLFSTEPTRRLERNFRKKDMHIIKRSNYNVKIDENGEDFRKNATLLSFSTPAQSVNLQQRLSETFNFHSRSFKLRKFCEQQGISFEDSLNLGGSSSFWNKSPRPFQS